MSTLSQFLAYAAAFEKAFESDDWSLVEPFFTEDAVYQVGLPGTFGGLIEGRPAILDYFKRVLDAFDRRFATRAIRDRRSARRGRFAVGARPRRLHHTGRARSLVRARGDRARTKAISSAASRTATTTSRARRSRSTSTPTARCSASRRSTSADQVGAVRRACGAAPRATPPRARDAPPRGGSARDHRSPRTRLCTSATVRRSRVGGDALDRIARRDLARARDPEVEAGAAAREEALGQVRALRDAARACGTGCAAGSPRAARCRSRKRSPMHTSPSSRPSVVRFSPNAPHGSASWPSHSHQKP